VRENSCFLDAPSSSTILSYVKTVPVNRANTMTVNPPFVVAKKGRAPPSINCKLAREKARYPRPLGPPVPMYVGSVPVAAALRFATDTNLRSLILRA
jgi:hypothetical protein